MLSDHPEEEEKLPNLSDDEIDGILENRPIEPTTLVLKNETEKKGQIEVPIHDLNPTAPNVEDVIQNQPLHIDDEAKDEEVEEEEEEDPMEIFKNASIQICIRAYEKRGDGINAFLVYKIETRVQNLPGFLKSHYEVWRRFSDFLGLREKLVERFQPLGVVIPMAPEKSVKALTKTKLNTANDESYTSDVAEKRTRQLERFLRRLTRSPYLVTNHELIDFLTFDATLPRSSTATISSGSLKRMFKTVSEMLTKIAFPMDENDRWFEHVHTHVEELEEFLSRLQSSVEILTSTRRELAGATDQLSKSMQMIASCEESTVLARTLSKLSETHESLSVIQKHESEMDAQLSELIYEHVQLTQVIKELFYERVKSWQNWQNQQQSLTKKREMKARNDLAGNMEKSRQLKSELDEQEVRVDAMEKEFLLMSKKIRQEYVHVQKERRKDLKAAFIERLENLAESEQQVLENWEKFAPEIKNIIN